MAIKKIKFNNLVWLDISQFGSKEKDLLKKKYKFHPLDFKDCFELEQNSKIDIYNNYVFLILHFPYFNKATNNISFNPVAVFLGRNYLITIHKNYKKINRIYYLSQRNNKIKQEYLAYGLDFALYKLLEYLLEGSISPLINDLKQKIQKIETSIFEDKTPKKTVKELSIIKRNILNFRSIVESQKFVLKSLSLVKNQRLISKDLKVYFDDINDFIDRIWAISSNQKEQTEGLSDANESLISFRTNRIITALTIISVALLPLTLFSSIYGMNIALPWQHDPHFVWGIFIGLAIFISLGLIYLKKRY